MGSMAKPVNCPFGQVFLTGQAGFFAQRNLCAVLAGRKIKKAATAVSYARQTFRRRDF